MTKSKLLLNEQPLLIMPILATKIGLNESIVLQQIHYWNEINSKANNNYKDGYHWTFNSYTEWQEQFPFWSTSTIHRTIKQLEKMKLIVTGNYNRLKIDRTKWYRIDYNVLQALETSPFGHIDKTNMSEWHDHLFNLGLPLPETNTKTKEKTTLTSDESDGYLFFDDLEEDYIKQINRILETGRSKISNSNYELCMSKITKVIEEETLDNLNKYLRKYEQDKINNRSVENFIKYIERYERE